MSHLRFETVLLFVCCCLAGCAGTGRIDPHVRTAIVSLRLDPKVAIPETAEFYAGAGPLLAAGLGGFIGGVIQASEREKSRQFTVTLTDAGVDIAAIVREGLIARLKRDPYWGTRYRENAPFVIRAEVTQYALVQKNTFSDYFRPTVSIRYAVIGPGEKTMTQGRGSVSAFNSALPEVTLEEVRSNPAILKPAFEKAAEIAINDILEEIAP